MRSFIIALGVVLGSTGIYMGYVSLRHQNVKAQEAEHLRTEILDLRQKITRLKGLRQRTGVRLEAAYVMLINDMNTIARLHGVVCTMGVDGANEADISRNAYPSTLAGLREVRFRGVLSGLARRGTLLSLLDALAALEESSPILFRSIGHEKDFLSFDVTVVGL